MKKDKFDLDHLMLVAACLVMSVVVLLLRIAIEN